MITARAHGDDVTFNALCRDLDDMWAMHVHPLALLDLAGSMVTQGMCVQA